MSLQFKIQMFNEQSPRHGECVIALMLSYTTANAEYAGSKPGLGKQLSSYR